MITRPISYRCLTRRRRLLSDPFAVIGVYVALFACAGCFGTGSPRPAHVEERTFEPDTSGNVAYMHAVPATTKPVRRASYDVGTQRTARVGEPMLEVRKFTAAERATSAVALRQFAQLCKKPPKGEAASEKLVCRSGRLASLRADAGQKLAVAGAIEEGGATYFMLQIPEKGGTLYVAVDASGRLKPQRYAAWAPSEPAETPLGTALRWQDVPVELDSSTPLFRLETSESVEQDGEFVRYQVTYRGLRSKLGGDFLDLLYREYRRDATDVPLHDQPLQYAASEHVIDVLGIRLEVESADAEQIVYTVIGD